VSHKEQEEFCKKILKKHPDFFYNVNVLDCGSLDINGNNRYLFKESRYCGVDVGSGRNVDVVSPIHLLEGMDEEYDIIISTECFEHDQYYDLSLKKIATMLKPGGAFLFTCATTGRPEHGTRRSKPHDAPLLEGSWSDYYKNLTEKDIRLSIPVDEVFEYYFFETSTSGPKDLRFFGIKKNI